MDFGLPNIGALSDAEWEALLADYSSKPNHRRYDARGRLLPQTLAQYCGDDLDEDGDLFSDDVAGMSSEPANNQGFTLGELRASIAAAIANNRASLDTAFSDRLDTLSQLLKDRKEMTSTQSAPLAGNIELASFAEDEAKGFESLRAYCDEYLAAADVYTQSRLTLANYVEGRAKDDGRRLTTAMTTALAKQSQIVEERHPLSSANGLAR